MKSLLLTNGFPPPFVGGSGVYLYNIFRRFPAGEVTIFTEMSRAPDPQDAATGMRFIRRSYIKPGVPRPITKMEKLRMMLFWTIELIYLCWRKRSDCVYVGQMFPVGLLGLLAKQLFGIPYIAFVYGEELTMLEVSGLRRKMVEAILWNAHRVVTISNFTIDQLIRAGVNRDCIVLVPPGVYPGFNPNVEVADLRTKLGLEGCKVILTVGRLTKRKGHAQVISALPRVLEAVPNVRYLIVGQDVGEGENLRNLVKRLGLERQVVFVGYVNPGYVNPGDLPKYYCACDVFVMANYELDNRDTEGLGFVFLEANACSKPVIGGRAGGAREAVEDGETGLLVDATDVEALSEALLKLLTDEEYARRLGANGRKRVIESFSWDVAASTVRELGLMVVQGKKVGGQ